MLSSLCKKILLLFSVICLLCSIGFCVNGQDITLSPSSITVEMIGGDVIDVNITANQDSGYDLICDISYSILPDDIGINVSFSVGDTFLLCSGDDVVIVMTINTSYIIMPGTYIIDIYVTAEKEIDDNNGDGGFSKPPSDDDSDDDEDETPDDTILVDDGPPDSDQPSSSMFWYDIPIVFISIFVMLLVLYMIRRRKKKNEN